ncbi:hypothetical protein ACFSCX_13330 [Bacillus salitolerans]|uniref:Uncharacterized protein n=1 Tax=Bacillus salitolerans TaxID=1437434 RepID=A0ABW4LR33_9BACI
MKRKKGSVEIDGYTIEELVTKYGEKEFFYELYFQLKTIDTIQVP